MPPTILSQISALQRMPVADLRAEWLRLYGEPARSQNRQFLFRRLAWRIQELQHGGLSDRSKERLAELAPNGLSRPVSSDNSSANTDPQHPQRHRDARLPTPGTVITKQYKGSELRVTVRDQGFEFDGAIYGSLTALTKEITGCRSINGRLFWGLSKRKRNI